MDLSSSTQVLWDRSNVKTICDFIHHFLPQLIISVQHIPIETVRPRSFVKVGAIYRRLYHLFPCKGGETKISRELSTIFVGIYLHLLFSTWLLSPVVCSLIDLGEVFGNLIFAPLLCPRTLAYRHVRLHFRPSLLQDYFV
jgi:hypothetical protein